MKGLVGLTHVVEELSHVEMIFMCSMECGLLVTCTLGGIRRCMKREDIVKP